jgi:hypothetical protein
LRSLGEILKAYSKEVIRQQPINIYEFSARYFAQLDQQEDELLDEGLGASPQLYSPSTDPLQRLVGLFLGLKFPWES